MAKNNEEKLIEVWNQWYRDPTNKEKSAIMMRAFEPIIGSFINAYIGKQYLNDPLMRGRAKNILFKALSRYDQTKGPITAYAWLYLQRLQRVLGKHQSTIKTSERDIMAARELNNVMEKLRDTLGREPSDQEIADAMGISIKRIERIRRLQNVGFEVSFEAERNDSSSLLPPISTPGVQVGSPEYVQILYETLEDPIDQRIMENVYGLNGRQKLPITEIAKQLKISRNDVSKRIDAINNKLIEIQTAMSS